MAHPRADRTRKSYRRVRAALKEARTSLAGADSAGPTRVEGPGAQGGTREPFLDSILREHF